MIKENCRLCDGETKYKFNLEVLSKYEIKYWECMVCNALQTQLPYWLDEAYERNNISIYDTGIAQRNIRNFVVTYVISKLFRLKDVIDYGGGDGLLCRLLRDHTINCYVKDKYAYPVYAQGFRNENFSSPDLVTCYEVLEHFVHPKYDLDEIFTNRPNVILISTGIYKDHISDWYYLFPQGGQHIFFYSEKSLLYIAKKYNYELQIINDFIFFTRDKWIYRKYLLSILLKKHVLRLLSGLIFIMPTRGVWFDFHEKN